MTDEELPRPERSAGDDVTIRLNSVNVRYGLIPALVDMGMEVRRGEIVCLLGGNASGKSTTMKTIISAVRVRAGEIWYEGRNICSWSMPQRVRAGIAIAPEARRIRSSLPVNGPR